MSCSRLIPGKSHTDPVVEDPLGGSEPLLEAMLALIWDDMRGTETKMGPNVDEFKARSFLMAVESLVPSYFLTIARWVNPFS